MAGKINKKYHDLYLFQDDEEQGKPEFVNQAQSQVNDVYNLIIDFFSRYFDKGDFLSKKRYGAKNHYMIPYNGEEVLLHWANHDQYYVKTDRHFKIYSFKVGDLQISFKIKEAETESNNNKGEKKYFVLADERAIQVENSHALTIWFQYRTLLEEEKKKYGTRSVQDEFLKEVKEKVEAKNNGLKALLLKRNGDESSILEKHLKRYVNENTHDFFIHKNLSGFLNRELEFFIKNEILDLDEMESMDEPHLKICMAKAKAIRGICQKIIGFLAQIEEFQKKLFEKKKFVIRTDYCMTLDKVPEEFYSEIGNNEKQVEEWNRLFKLEENISSFSRNKGKKTLNPDFLKSHRFLVLDTKFFQQEFTDMLLACFENLDDKIGGIIIKSENFQALNLLIEKYREKMKCAYIDPPYNTGNDEFIYKDNYQHSSWLTMMEDRLRLMWELLTKDSAIFVSIDDNEQSHLRSLLKNIFGQDNEIAQIIWKKRSGPPNDKTIGSVHEFILCFGVNVESAGLNLLERTKENLSRFQNPDNDTKGTWVPGDLSANAKGGRFVESLYYEIINPKTGQRHLPPEGACWRFNREKVERLISAGIIYFGGDGKGRPKIKRYLSEVREGMTVPTIWEDVATNTHARTEINNLFGENNAFDTPKPLELLKRIIKIAANSKGIVIDFFAGSGTTAHAVLNLNSEDRGNRQYILVEMGNYFDTVIKSRIQKVMYSKEWKAGKPISKEGISHMFKYQYLEQYEDTLNNIIFSDLSKTAQETLDGFDDYFLRYMLDYETRESPARLTVKQFENPFDYKLNIISGSEEKTEIVDLVETFNYLLGLEVERIRVFEDNNRKYRVVFGRKGDSKIAVIWRSIKGINYEKDRDFVENTILKNEKSNTIYINGKDSLIPSAEPIEPEFKRLMGA